MAEHYLGEQADDGKLLWVDVKNHRGRSVSLVVDSFGQRTYPLAPEDIDAVRFALQFVFAKEPGVASFRKHARPLCCCSRISTVLAGVGGATSATLVSFVRTE